MINSKVHIIILGFIAVFIFCIDTSTGQEEGLKNIRNYSPAEYLSDPQNWAILQDRRGVMYFGNTSEITEYDGVS